MVNSLVSFPSLQDAAKKMKKEVVMKKYAKTKHDDLPTKKESVNEKMRPPVKKVVETKRIWANLSSN